MGDPVGLQNVKPTVRRIASRFGYDSSKPHEGQLLIQLELGDKAPSVFY